MKLNKNLILRSVTGTIFVLVLVGGILYGPTTYSLLFAAITALTTWEFCTIMNKNAKTQVNRFITTSPVLKYSFRILYQ